ncbi:MAG: SRPBCC domain-containing protein [Ginsengibacter sp.]
MKNDLIVSESVVINAAPSKVWDALTNPEIIKKYLFGTETITDWKVGSEIIFQGEYGENKEHTYRDKGIIKQNVPNELLSYSYWSGFSGLENKPENYSLVTYSLQSDDNKKTIFTWTQKGYATEEGYQHSLSGMKEFLEQIKKLIEEG